MKQQCTKCGESVTLNGLGRKPLAIPVINICDALQSCSSVSAAAEKLHCSRPYIYKVLKTHNLTMVEVLAGKVGGKGYYDQLR